MANVVSICQESMDNSRSSASGAIVPMGVVLKMIVAFDVRFDNLRSLPSSGRVHQTNY